MSDEPVADSGDPLAPVLAVVRDPSDGQRYLPRLLGLLDEDDERRRLAAAWGVCVVATAAPETVPSLVRRLADRLDDEPALATEVVLTFLSARFPDAVEAEFTATEGTDGADGRSAPSGATGAGGGPSGRGRAPLDSLGNRDVGRTTKPGEASTPGSGRVYEASTRGADDAGPDGPDGPDGAADPSGDGTDEAATGAGHSDETGSDSRPDETGSDSRHDETGSDSRHDETGSDPRHDEAEADSGGEGEDAPGDRDPAAGGAEGAGGSGGRDDYDRDAARRAADRRRGDVPLTIGYPVQEAAEEWTSVDTLIDVAYESRFDQLTVYGRRTGRYAEVYRALGVVGGREYSLALALFHRPDARRAAFAADLIDRVDRWAGVADDDGVVTVLDRSREPRPWAALEFTGETLADRGSVGPGEALWNARRLAGSLGALHENGLVHAGLDPRNVAYHGEVFGDEARQPPLLANVGLMHVFRMHFDPTKRLDARYAAPEYYDRDFGKLDHLTDVYHLGGVVYRLFTGEPPYDGDYATVRERILSGGPPRPSDVADVPPGLDDVVTKAMARRKLGRYETVAFMARDLRALAGDGDAVRSDVDRSDDGPSGDDEREASGRR